MRVFVTTETANFTYHLSHVVVYMVIKLLNKYKNTEGYTKEYIRMC